MTIAAGAFTAYNIFVTANISPASSPETQISHLFAIIGQPVRIQILAIIGNEPACVCHLEAVLGLRQASISQHLMVLRKASLVTTQREGRNIFYRLVQPGVLQVIEQAAVFAGMSPGALSALAVRPVAGCPCPQCNPGTNPELSCKTLGSSKSS